MYKCTCMYYLYVLGFLHALTGAGKTMLMDMFYRRAAVAKKKRVHFNAFMLDIHDSMWSLVVHVHTCTCTWCACTCIILTCHHTFPHPSFLLQPHSPRHSLSLTHSPSLMPPHSLTTDSLTHSLPYSFISLSPL